MKHIYLVEDHAAIREGVTRYLNLSGYQVSGFAEIQAAASAIALQEPDLLVQDVMMPDGDGFEFVKRLRSQYDFPVIFMTARASESDRIMGFELGGDDYVVKPFSPKELVLRIDAILRRVDANASVRKGEHRWHLDSSVLVFDERTHECTLNGKEVPLTAAEWRIMAYLIDQAGNLVTRAQLLASCFDYSFESYDRIIDTHIKNIRSKIADQGTSWIETVRGYGYRFAGVGPQDVK